MLLSLRDIRARFYIDDLAPDPARAAETVAARWQKLKDKSAEIEFDW